MSAPPTSVLNNSFPTLYSSKTMTASASAPKKEHVAIPPWAIAILVSIVVAGVGNVAAISTWKGALDSKLSAIERQLTMIENLPGRVSVLEAQRAADEREWRSRGEDLSRRVTETESQLRELLRSSSRPLPR